MSRVTNSMLAANYLTNMNRNLRNMQTIQSQLSSGKEVSRPSDNPYKVSRTMQLYSEIDANKQYNENIKDVSNWLDTTDTALGQVGNLFGRVRELLVSAGNASYDDDEKKAIQDEIKQKVHELSQILNTNFDGAYIFGGTKSTSKPIMVDNNGDIQYANKKGEAINNIYLNIAGEVANTSISDNKLLKQADEIYLDINGKVTTSSKAKDGTDNIKLVPTSALYVASDGTVSTLPASGNKLYLKDDLYIDLNGNCTPSKTTDNTLITSDDELLYLTPSGQITTTYNSTYTIIPTGQTLYKDSSGKVTPLAAGNTVINSSTPLYKDEKGFVTTSAATINTKLADAIPPLVPSPITSVTGVELSTYTSGTGYSKTAIPSSGDAYIDSRGILTDSPTTDLSLRSATLKQLWENSYIDLADEQLKGGTPATLSSNKQIHLYKDSTGQVTTSPGSYPANEQILLGTTLYKDSNGKVTTAAGLGTIPIQLDESVYVDLNGDVTTNSTVTNAVVSLRDNLSITTSSTTDKAKAVIGNVPATDSAIPSDTITLYVDASGNISRNSTGTTKIILGDSLYLDSYGNVSAFKETQNILINSDDKLYSDANGNVTNLAANIQITSGINLYKDFITGKVTTSSGGTPPNEIIDLKNTALYQDGKGNVTTVAGSNTPISNTISLYKDVNGNITTTAQNTLINSDTKLYNDGGNITTKLSGSLPAGTSLYLNAGNITTSPSGSPIATIPIPANTLYIDGSGNITNISTAPNMPIPSGTELYDDGGIVKTKLIKTGESLYADSNGKIVPSKTALNTQLTINDKVYVDPSGKLTMSSTSANTKLTAADVKNLENELKSSSTTSERKTEINKILSDDNVGQLMQICSDLNVEISQGVFIDYNTTAADILEYKDKTGTSKSVVSVLNDIIKNLNSPKNPTNPGDISKVTGEGLTQIDAIIQNVLQKRSEVGAMTNRMESAQAKNEDENLNMTDILSKTEDIDFTEKMMEYSVMQTIYMAALQTSAKILPQTILNYL